MLAKVTGAMMVMNVVILCIVAFMMLYPAPLPIIYNEPFPLDKTEVKRGEQISYLVHLNKRANYDAVLNRNIVCDDGNLVTLAPGSSHVGQGEQRIWVTITVPMKTSLGTCHLRLNNTYHINPLRDEHLELRTQDFNVIE